MTPTQITLPIDEILPYPNNPRINDDAVDAVVASIKRFGYNSPILVDTKNVIVAGHTRWLALKKLGVAEVTVLVLDLPEDKLKQFRLIENKTSEKATWDMSLLVDELRAIGGAGEMDEFFRSGELDGLMAQLEQTSSAVPTQAQINQASDDLTNKFVKQAAGAKEKETTDTVEVKCAHCGESYHIQKPKK